MVCASGGTLTGMVRDYRPAELAEFTSFPKIPERVADFHVGKLLFVCSKSRFRSVELRQCKMTTLQELGDNADTKEVR